jgi:PAS domain S-box-containing protein
VEDRLTVLVIDDSADDRMLYRRVLEEAFGAALNLVEEGSGEGGLAAIEKAEPGCVLLDYSLPGRNGIEILKRIRPEHPHLAVIMLTGQGNEAIAVQSMKEGAQDYITKATITAETLSRVIRMAIDHSGLQKYIEEQHETLAATNRSLSQEIAERREAEEELRRSQALLTATLDASPFAIVIRDTDFKILFWSRAAEKMFGYKAAEILGRSDSVFDESPGARQLQAVGRRTFAGETVQAIEQERRRSDGSVIQVRLTAAPIYIADRLSGFVGIIEDVTERSAIERQLVQAQKMEAIGNLTGGMAHDFNNMLSVIIGNLDLIRERTKGTAATDELVADALAAGLRGADLTHRLLAFARQQSLQPERVDVNERVGGITKLLDRTIGEEIEIAVELATDLWPVTADPAQLESAIINLANNARDAMPKGGKLTVATSNHPLDKDYTAQHPDLIPGDYAMIEVTDSGTGMPPEVAARIFEPFFTTKKAGEGTGLGLSMVFGFVKQSAGHIDVYSELGIGTTFRLFLPRHTTAGVAIMPSVDEELPLGRGQTILVVEDHAGLRRLVIRQVLSLGYRFLEADGANAALALLASHPADLLFSDVIMPGPLNGSELARAVQNRWPQMRVVLTSGFTAKGAASIDPGTRVLAKPYRKLDLARALRDALRG